MRTLGAVAVALLVTLVASCTDSSRRLDLRQNSEHFRFRVAMEPRPSYAREPVAFRVTVTDLETGQPVQGGEGRIFATNRDSATVWDALLPVGEVGTYQGSLNFLTAGLWAMALQFRPDSTKPLERIDWTQEVFEERSAVP